MQVSRKLIPEKYVKVRAQIQGELESTKHVSITTDLWISQHQHRAYISLTAHFINYLRLVHISCIRHTLQLAVKKALEITRVKKALGRCRKCVEHFNKSTKATYKLRKKQELLKIPQHGLIQDCITCWGKYSSHASKASRTMLLPLWKVKMHI